MGDVIRGSGSLSGQVEADAAPAEGRLIAHKLRKLASRPSWKIADITTALGLIVLLLPSWLLPEALWAPFSLWRILAHIPGRRAIKQTGKSIQAALGDIDQRRAEAIARDLKAAVYELRMEDLRGWRPHGWNPKMVLEGEDHLRYALAGGRGAILWVAPFVFNSGPVKIVLHQKGYRLSHLSSPQHGYSDSCFGVEYLNRVRCIPEDRHIVQRIVFDRSAPTTAMRRMMRALKANEVVSIVASSTEGYELVKGPIFGGKLPVAVGAPRLAALTGAPLLPLFTVRDPKHGFRMVIEEPIAIDASRSSDERCIAAALEYFRRSEPWVRKFPEQWRAWSKWRPA
ncbi:MAG TPA: lysophospholipid acyltransferase family protein [Dongiaceae bacterium]|jgi:lauroyl/myristoyl acyltransferase|nr:lysophospholipid acyltransferase family protein [Dongiaceae bacterium]